MGSKTVPVIRPRIKKVRVEPNPPPCADYPGYRITSLPSRGLFFDLEMLGAFKGTYVVEIRVSGNSIEMMVFFNPGRKLFYGKKELKKGLEAIRSVFIDQKTPETFHVDISLEDWNERTKFYDSFSNGSLRTGTGIVYSNSVKHREIPGKTSLQQDLVEYILHREGIDGVIQILFNPLKETSEGKFQENLFTYNCLVRVLLFTGKKSDVTTHFDKGALHGLKALLAKYGINCKVISGMRIRKGKISCFLHSKRGKMHPCPSRSINSIIKLPSSSFGGIVPISQELPSCINYRMDTGGINGDGINIGEILYPHQLRGQIEKIPLSVFENHASIWGLTGEGKSRFLYGLSREFIRSGVKSLIIDLKGEYLPAIGEDDLIYLKPGSGKNPLTINMFKLPDGLEIEDHAQFIYSTFVNVIGSENISPQMSELLRKATLLTVRDRGDFKYFLDAINNPTRLSIKGSYLESTAAALYQRIVKFSFGTAGKVFNSGKSNISIAAFLKNNIILDLQLFNTNENYEGMYVFLNVLFHQFFHVLKCERKAINIAGNIRNVIIIDESQLVIGLKNRKNREPTIIEKLPWVIRSYGCSIIFAGTDPIISDTLLYNTGLSVVFFTKQSPVIMSNILGTTVTNYLDLRDKLDKRMFILSIRGQMTILKTLEFNIRNPI